MDLFFYTVMYFAFCVFVLEYVRECNKSGLCEAAVHLSNDVEGKTTAYIYIFTFIILFSVYCILGKTYNCPQLFTFCLVNLCNRGASQTTFQFLLSIIKIIKIHTVWPHRALARTLNHVWLLMFSKCTLLIGFCLHHWCAKWFVVKYIIQNLKSHS